MKTEDGTEITGGNVASLSEDTQPMSPPLHAALLREMIAPSANGGANGAVNSRIDSRENNAARSDTQEVAERSAVVVCSLTNRRVNNEDSHLVLTLLPHPSGPPVTLLALSDGMGGHDFGEHASREALRRLALFVVEQVSILPSLNRQGDLEPPSVETLLYLIGQAIPLVSAHVQRISEINGWNRAGATLVVAAIVGDRAAIANVGDSPAFHVRVQDKQAVRLTEDHSLAGMLLKAGLISPGMAKHHEGKSQLEHYIGGARMPNELPTVTIDLLPGDCLLLCSDGVSNHVPETYIAEELSNRPTLEMGQLVERMVAFFGVARQQGERDNQTIVLYRHGANSYYSPEVVVLPDTGPVEPTLAGGLEEERSADTQDENTIGGTGRDFATVAAEISALAQTEKDEKQNPLPTQDSGGTGTTGS